MAYADRRLVVVHIESLAVRGQGSQEFVGAACFQRILLRFHPGFRGRGVRRDRLRGRAQILANMIEINQVAALFAEPFLDLADDP